MFHFCKVIPKTFENKTIINKKYINCIINIFLILLYKSLHSDTELPFSSNLNYEINILS